jgi:hypothetical protein
MRQLQGLNRADDPELYGEINLLQTLLCVVTNPSMHARELELCGIVGEPERKAVKLRLEQELWRLIDRIPLPTPEYFVDWINSLALDQPEA